MLFVYVASWAILKQQQRIIESGHRKQIGLFLIDAMTAEDTVYLEPIGYIGYFSQRHILDFPGFVSPSVVEVRRSGLDFYGAMAEIQPSFLVLRPWEAEKGFRCPGGSCAASPYAWTLLAASTMRAFSYSSIRR
jgi:hypothetical protein